MGEPVRFDGNVAIDCDLIGGAVRDFNLIYDPARAAMNVERLAAGLHEARGLGLLTLADACEIAGFGEVPAGSFLFFESDQLRRIGVTGAALLVTYDQARDTRSATAWRSSVPSEATIPAPKRSTMASNTGAPGTWSERTMASASITTAPRSANLTETVDLPEPIPPVRPMRSTPGT